MQNYFKEMFRNPFTQWIKYFLLKIYFECKYKKEHLRIGYMSKIENCQFSLYNTLYEYVSLNNVQLGAYTYVANNSVLCNTTIGKFCSIGFNVSSGLGQHPSSTFVSTHPIFFSMSKQAQVTFVDKNYFNEFEDITIGNDVWIGANVTILDGIKISDGVIVAAGSVVTKDIPPYAVVGGVPAKIIKYRFEEGEIALLLQLKWWDKDIEWIKNNFKLFHDIGNFIC